MFRDEYIWAEAARELLGQATLLIRGNGRTEREQVFLEEWHRGHPNVAILTVTFTSLDRCELEWTDVAKGAPRLALSGPVRSVLIDALRKNFDALESVVLDITSLQHSAIMYLVKVLLDVGGPGRLFAVYAEPREYVLRPETGYGLSTGFLGLRAVPGYVRAQSTTDETLVAFLGFEGERAVRLIEDRETIRRFVPVIGLPAYQPGWNVRSLASAGRAVLSSGAHEAIRSCAACSVTDAYQLLNELYSSASTRTFAVAPLGTRPHTLATALFAVRHPRSQVIFDHPIEAAGRSAGVGRMHIYHLTGLLP